jgi:hypothetical protein
MDPVSITFESVCQSISQKSFVTDLEKIYGPMVTIRKMVKLMGVYRAARARCRHRRPENDTAVILPNIWNLRKGDTDPCSYAPFVNFCSEITTWLSRKFPLNEEYTDMLWTDGDEEDLVMSVCNPGIDLCWDDASELIECPENWNKEVGLMLLAIYAVFLGEFVDDESLPDFWDSAASWFCWGIKLPWWLYLPAGMWRTDNRKFYRILCKCDLPDVADSFRMAWHDTGQFFLDLEERNDSYYVTDETRQEYTVENILRLEKLWTDAKPIYDRGWAACYRAAEHPEIYSTVMKLLGRCIVHSQASKNKKKLSNRELMEMAAECKDRLEANRSGSSSEDKEDEDGCE